RAGGGDGDRGERGGDAGGQSGRREGDVARIAGDGTDGKRNRRALALSDGRGCGGGREGEVRTRHRERRLDGVARLAVRRGDRDGIGAGRSRRGRRDRELRRARGGEGARGERRGRAGRQSRRGERDTPRVPCVDRDGDVEGCARAG